MWNLPLRNFSAAGVAALLLAALWSSATQPVATPDLPPDITPEPALAEPTLSERVLELPEDAGVWHTTIVYPQRNPSDAASRRLAAALASEPRLQSLLAQTKTYIYAASDPLWRERLARYYGDATPAIVLQRPDGRVCYKASGANLPAEASALGDALATAIAQCRPRPAPSPSPSPSPQPGPQPGPAIPDLTPRVPEVTPATDSGESHVLWMIVIPIAAGLAGLAQEWKQSNR
jgi:hypothetical protein